MADRLKSVDYVEQRRGVMEQHHDVRNGEKGNRVGDTSLGGAVAELNNQHPIKWDDLGPHHDGKK